MCSILTIGTLVIDLIAVDLPRIAGPGEAIHVKKPIDMAIGGHAANVAIDLIKLGVNCDVHVCGAIGDDVFGEIIEGHLSKYKLKPYLQIVKGIGTARNLILVVKGEDRRFHVYPGANRYLNTVFVSNVIEKVKPDFIYIAIGFSPGFDSNIVKVLVKAKEIGSKIMIDVAYPQEFIKKAFMDSIMYADVIHCNDLELKKLTNAKSLIEGLKTINKYNPKLVFVTLGSRGALALYKGYLIRQKSYSVNVVDPTGAGDAFCAGVIYSLTEYGFNVDVLGLREITNILAYAQAVGALATTKPGASTAIEQKSLNILLEQRSKIIEEQEISKL